MSSYIIEIRLQVLLRPGASAEELEHAEWELMKLFPPRPPVHAVGRMMLMAPPGARAEEYQHIAGINLEVEPAGVETALSSVAGWVAGEPDVNVRISVAGKSIVLSDPSNRELRALKRLIKLATRRPY